jgi:hypothetical protein
MSYGERRRAADGGISQGVAADAKGLLAELRTLVERMPLPHPVWHRYVPEMHAAVVVATAALDVLEQLPEAAAELRRQVEGDAAYPDDAAGGPAIAAARARLRAVPIPEGEHPYLGEIMLALEAAEAALATLAATAADSEFAEAWARRRELGFTGAV